MEILCRVNDQREGDGHPLDVRVEITAGHTVADLIAALNRFPSTPGDVELVRASDGQILDPEAPADTIGLFSGAEIVVRPVAAGPAARGTDEPDRALELVVASGPDAGRRCGLEPGHHLIGRDPSCHVVLDDPRLGRVEARLDVTTPTFGPGTPTVTVESGSELAGPITLDGTPAHGPVTLVPGGPLVGVGASTLRIQPRWPDPPWSDGLGEIAFHRTPYFPTPVIGRAFEATGDIPERPEPVRFAYLAALAPLVMGITMALVYSPRFLLFAGLTPVLAVVGWIDQRRRASQRYGRGAVRFRQRLDGRRAEVAAARADERRQRFASAPDLAELADRARTRSVDLWVRDRSAPDLLCLRLGLGDLPSAVRVAAETRGDEVLRAELAAELAAGSILHQVPVTISLIERPVVALVGRRVDTTALAASLLVQAACLHSPEDVVVVAALGPDRQMAPWLRWLPHTRAPSSPLAAAHLVHTRAGADRLLRELVVEAEQRAASTDHTVDRRWPWLLVVVDQRLEPDPGLVSRLADLAPQAGLSLLWLTPGRDRVPRQAVATVVCSPAPGPEPSRLAVTDPTVADQDLVIDRAPNQLASDVASQLAPVRDASSAMASSALPRTVTLHQGLGVEQVTPEWVAGRWREAGNRYTLPTPVGLGAAGPVVLDLVEHGPHGLIGGTSGAGKSELLMSLVAGLVVSSPPTRLNLLFVDYKGGAASDQFRHLPHTVGYVTNLDALLARRALVSLRAELNRRMALLQGRAKDLAEMLERHPDEAPASLVIVVDEFATLVREVPEFVAGVVDIAQRGRSLGIHLLLATQRPSGAVNDNILANTNLRIALRMLDGAESSSVIGTHEAATIPTPLKGRAFARLGPGQLVAFQTAWSGAPRLARHGLPPVLVTPLAPSGGPTVDAGVASDRARDGGSGVPTQLAGVLDAVATAASRLGMARGRSPWLDELPDHLPLAEVLGASRWSGATEGPEDRSVCLGLIDDPDAQAQYPARVDLAGGGGLLVVGTGGSGKTTALRTLAVSAALGPSTSGPGSAPPLTLVVLDFASRQLLALGALRCCAVTAGGDDLEGVTRAIALLDRLLEQRRTGLAAAALEGRAAPLFDPVLLLIDDYGNLAQTFEGSGVSSHLHDWLEALNRVIVDGRQVGIHTALSATRRAVVKASLLSAITNRLVLRQADGAGYTDLGLPASLASDGPLPPGRGFLNGATMVQVAVLAPAPPPAPGRSVGASGRCVGTVGAVGTGDGSETAALRGLVASLGGRPVPALVVPPLAAEVGPLPAASQHWLVPLGQGDLDPQPVLADLTFDPLVVVGEPRSGRSTALATVARQLAAQGIEVWAVGPAGSGLARIEFATRRCLARSSQIVEALNELADLVERGERAGLEPVPHRVLVFDDVDLVEDPALDPPLSRLLAHGLRYVAATTGLRGYSTSPLIQDMKKARSLLVLQPAGNREVQELSGVNPRLRPGLALPPGRGVLIASRRCQVVQVSGRRR